MAIKGKPATGLIANGVALVLLAGCGGSSHHETFHEHIESERHRIEKRLQWTKQQRRRHIAEELGLSSAEARRLERGR